MVFELSIKHLSKLESPMATTKKQTFLNREFQLTGGPSLQPKRLNTRTLSIHSMDSADDDELFVSSIQNNASASNPSRSTAAPPIVKKGRKSGTKEKSIDPHRATASTPNDLLLSIKEDTAATRSEIAANRLEFKEDLKRLSSRTDSKIATLDGKLSKVTNDMNTLFSRVRDVERRSNSNATALSSSDDYELRKQERLRNNITIANFPILPNENYFDILNGVLRAIDCKPATVDEISDAKRVPNSKSNLIIVKFRDFERKLDIMKRKADSSIMLSNILKLEPGDRNPRIYINTQLTPFYSRLSYLCRHAASNKRIHSGWLSSSGFLVRLQLGQEPVAIANEAELKKLLDSPECAAQLKRGRSPNHSQHSIDSPSNQPPPKQLLQVSGVANLIDEAAKKLAICDNDRLSESNVIGSAAGMITDP